MVSQSPRPADWFAILCDPLSRSSASTRRCFRLAEGHELHGSRRDALASFDPDASLVYFAPGAIESANTHGVLLRLAEVFSWANRFARATGRHSVRSPFFMVAEDGTGVVDQLRAYIQVNRLALGDDGAWCVWPLRAYLAKQAGVRLEDLALAAERIPLLPVPSTLPDPDYADAVAEYRFPSLSLLRGYSQPVAELRGQGRYCRLFIHDGPGVYVAFDGLRPLYVGMAQHLSQRLANVGSHHKLKTILELHPHARLATIPYPVWDVADFSTAVTGADISRAWARVRELLFAFEAACIAHYNPIYNGVSLGADANPA